MVVLRWVMISLVLIFSAPAHADFAAGQAAYDRGDFNAAYNEWLPLAEAGDAEAQFRVGRLYDVGEGRSRNGPMAVEWYEKSFKQKNLKAGHNLGYLYDVGKIIPRNYGKAFEYYLYGAYQNDPDSQRNLGLMYFGGHGMTHNFIEGYKWLFISKASGGDATEEQIDEFLKYTRLRDKIIGQKKAREWLINHSRE
jgi:uncharacterized protein